MANGRPSERAIARQKVERHLAAIKTSLSRATQHAEGNNLASLHLDIEEILREAAAASVITAKWAKS